MNLSKAKFVAVKSESPEKDEQDDGKVSSLEEDEQVASLEADEQLAEEKGK